MKYAFLLFGTLFGFLVSRAGATTFDFYAKLFLFEDLQLLWVIATAVIVGAAGVAVLRLTGARVLATGAALVYEVKPMRGGLAAGALVFGVGWGLAGACPGTAPAMLGEGKLAAGFTIIGILLGTYLYGLLRGSARSAGADVSSLAGQ